MKTNLIKTELTPAQILNPQLNGGYHLEGLTNKLETFCPLIHLLKIEITDYNQQSLNNYQLGALEYITPYIEQMLNQTSIPDFLELISIDTKEQDYEGVHIWTFALKDPDLIDDEPSLKDTLTDAFKEVFPYDSEACFNHSPQIKYLQGLFLIMVPFTC